MTKISEQVEERELKCNFSGSMRPSPAGHEIFLLCRPSHGPARCPLSVSKTAQTPTGSSPGRIQGSRLSCALSWHSGLPGRGRHTLSCSKTGTVSCTQYCDARSMVEIQQSETHPRELRGAQKRRLPRVQLGLQEGSWFEDTKEDFTAGDIRG